jgi:hypothetical protein
VRTERGEALLVVMGVGFVVFIAAMAIGNAVELWWMEE